MYDFIIIIIIIIIIKQHYVILDNVKTSCEEHGAT